MVWDAKFVDDKDVAWLLWQTKVSAAQSRKLRRVGSGATSTPKMKVVIVPSVDSSETIYHANPHRSVENLHKSKN
jgi:hypothetical protein